MTTVLLENREATAKWGAKLGSLLRPGDVIALVGDLGAGKTTLTQAIARGMAISEAVTSPTYTLVQEYNGAIPLFHCDPYRLENAADVVGFGFEEYFERGGVVVAEWADKIAAYLPDDRLTVTLEIAAGENDDFSEAPRRVTLEASGSRSQAILAALTGEAAKS